MKDVGYQIDKSIRMGDGHSAAGWFPSFRNVFVNSIEVESITILREALVDES